jgi:predicted RNA-binding Zn ribbon-like protein
MVMLSRGATGGQGPSGGGHRAGPPARSRGVPPHPAAGAVGSGAARAGSWTFHLGCGALCLDFANTTSWRGSGAPVDHLPTYGELIRFAQQSKLLSEEDAARLRRESARRPEAAARALRKAVTLREALYRIFARLASGHSPLATDLAILNASLPGALTRLRVAPGDDGFAWTWEGERAALDRLLWPVARDAAVFLTSMNLARLRTCGNPRCRWVFHDGTRSGTRRWCSMAVCGNRAKQLRHRRRAAHARAAPARRQT